MCEEAPESMIHSVKWVQSDLATVANSCARRRSVLPSFFFTESLTCDPGVFGVPGVLTGPLPSEPPPSAQQFSIICPIFLHFGLVQCGRFLPFLDFCDCFELKDLSGVFCCLANSQQLNLDFLCTSLP